MNRAAGTLAIVFLLVAVADAGKRKPAPELIVSPSQLPKADETTTVSTVSSEPAPATVAAAAETPDAQLSAEPTIVVVRGETAPAESVVPTLRAGSLSVNVNGYLRPTVGMAYRSAAVERDRFAYGVTGSSLDLGVKAQVGGGVSGVLYVRVATEEGDDGSTQGKVNLERALVRYQPASFFTLSVGRDFVPLSAQSATPTVARMFPGRIGLDDTFVLPADVGAQAAFTTAFVTALTGVWNGVSSDAQLSPGASERGLLYSGRIELTPLGTFPFDERLYTDTLKVGIGAAVTYRAATEFTPTGMTGTKSRDLRAAASLRAAWRGLFVEGEVLRRQITDDLSMRPDVATGAYVQASYRFTVGAIDLSPLFRAGIERERELSAPADGSSVEVGAAVFPLARSSDRLTISALAARFVDPVLGESKQVLTQARLAF